MIDLSIIDFISAIFITIFIGLVIALLGLIVAISRRSSFLRDLQNIQQSIKELISGMHAIRVDLQHNQILKNEPFLSRVKALDVELSWMESEFSAFREQYLEVQEKIEHWEKSDRLNYLVTLLPWSEYNRLLPSIKIFDSKIVVLNDYLTKAILHTREIANLGWEIASQIRESVEKLNDNNRVLHALCEKNVQGNDIDDAKRIIDQLHQKISSIPQELLTNTKDEVINQIEYAAICQTYEIYQEISPVIDNLHLHLYQWWNDYQLAVRTINSAQSTLTNTSGLMQELCKKIELGNLFENLKTIQSIGDILGETLKRVEIESLAEMTQEASRICQLAQETADSLKMARRNQSILEPLLNQIETGILQLDEQISSLGKHATFPIVWDQSGSRFFKLTEQHKEIVVGDRLRSPDEIEQHLTIAINLYKEINELSTRIKQVASTHKSLCQLTQTEEINQGLFWCQEARRIIENAQVYSETNFPKNLSTKKLASELENIQTKHQILLNNLFSNPILESSLSQLLADIRGLSDLYSVIREQVAEVKSYLTIFREDINQAHQTLQRIQPFLNQMESIVKSNPLLMQQGAENEIGRLRKNLDMCITKVNDLSSGTIHNKQTTVSTVESRIESACQRWIIYIDKNITIMSAELRERLKNLSKMANLDDALILQSRDLLSLIDSEEKRLAAKTNKPSDYQTPVIRLKFKNDLWQKLLAAYGEIEEMIYNPISEAYQAVIAQKDLATKQLHAATEHIPEKHAWPPTSITMPLLTSNLSVIDAVWNKNISQPMRAIWWVKRFGEIWIKYQEFTHSVNMAIDTCIIERQTIIELEQQLDFVDQKWAALEQQMMDNRTTTSGIRTLRKNIEQEYKQIKRRWQFSGSVPGNGPTYEEIRNSLEELNKKFEYTRVVVSDENGEKIEINMLGQHIAESGTNTLI